jgi:gephyrin
VPSFFDAVIPIEDTELLDKLHIKI